MTSKLRIIRRFFSLTETTRERLIWSTTNINQIQYRNGINNSRIMIYSGNYSLLSYILDFDTKTNILNVLDFEIKINFDKDDIKAHDDMELLLKYGRYIADDYVIKILNDTLKLNLTIEDFNEFLK